MARAGFVSIVHKNAPTIARHVLSKSKSSSSSMAGFLGTPLANQELCLARYHCLSQKPRESIAPLSQKGQAAFV
jgi:hypothetical protein